MSKPPLQSHRQVPFRQLLGHGTGVQRAAAFALSCLSEDSGDAIAIAAAGAISPMVQLLGSGASDIFPANLLRDLARLSDGMAATIAAAGAIPPLMQLLRSSPDDLTKECAARALMALNDASRAATADVDLLEETARLGVHDGDDEEESDGDEHKTGEDD